MEIIFIQYSLGQTYYLENLNRLLLLFFTMMYVDVTPSQAFLHNLYRANIIYVFHFVGSHCKNSISLQLLSAAAEKLELLSDNETPVKNKFILGIDPRSPTTDFKRTPIILDPTEGDFPRTLRNKNLDKVRRTELLTSPIRSTEEYKASPSVIPPKLLQSSPIKARTDAYKRRSLVGLLETNIDFTETDLDSILKEKYKTENVEEITETKECFPPDLEASSENNNLNNKSDNEILENSNILESLEGLIENIDIKASAEHEANIDNQSEAIDDKEMTVDSLQEIENNSQENIEDLENSNETQSEDAPINIPDQIKSAPVSPPTIPLSPILPSKEIKSAPDTPPLVDLTADIKELDKKLTNLIYEDDLVVCPRIVKLKDNSERSPLKNYNKNESRTKAIQKLKVSDKPRRTEYAVSKIPVFRDKKGKMKNQVQCENTPPRNMEKKARHKQGDWDTKDNTLYL